MFGSLRYPAPSASCSTCLLGVPVLLLVRPMQHSMSSAPEGCISLHLSPTALHSAEPVPLSHIMGIFISIKQIHEIFSYELGQPCLHKLKKGHACHDLHNFDVSPLRLTALSTLIRHNVSTLSCTCSRL